MGGLSVKKKEGMFLRKTAALAGVFTDSSVACDGGRGAKRRRSL